METTVFALIVVVVVAFVAYSLYRDIKYIRNSRKK